MSETMADHVPSRKEPWHLDKKVPIGLIGALIFQTCSIIWWAANVDNRTRNYESRLAQLEQSQASSAERLNQLLIQLGILNERVAAQSEALRRIETALDKKVDRR